jgi:peptidoglycan/LPS O-acetylase OafA/YrhL
VVGHLLTALVILLEGVSRCEHFRQHWPLVVLLWVSGVVVLIVTVRHKSISKRFRYSQTLLYCIEALVSAVIALMYIREGKVAVQYPLLIASYLFAGLAGFSVGNPSGSPHTSQ